MKRGQAVLCRICEEETAVQSGLCAICVLFKAGIVGGPAVIVDGVGFRILATSCSKCGSKNIFIVWRCDEPNTVSYECQEENCRHIDKVNQTVRRG